MLLLFCCQIHFPILHTHTQKMLFCFSFYIQQQKKYENLTKEKEQFIYDNIWIVLRMNKKKNITKKYNSQKAIKCTVL